MITLTNEQEHKLVVYTTEIIRVYEELPKMNRDLRKEDLEMFLSSGYIEFILNIADNNKIEFVSEVDKDNTKLTIREKVVERFRKHIEWINRINEVTEKTSNEYNDFSSYVFNFLSDLHGAMNVYLYE